MGRIKEALGTLNWGVAEYSSTGTQQETGKSRSRNEDKNWGIVLQGTVEIVKDHHGRAGRGTKDYRHGGVLPSLKREGRERDQERNPSRTEGAKSSKTETIQNCRREGGLMTGKGL